MRLLVADGDALERETIGQLLRDWGVEADLVSEGSEAVARYTAALSDGTPYGLVAVSLRLPDGDGRTAIRDIRQAEQATPGADAARIMVIAESSEFDMIIDSLDQGCDCYLAAPYLREDLGRHLLHLGVIAEEDLIAMEGRF